MTVYVPTRKAVGWERHSAVIYDVRTDTALAIGKDGEVVPSCYTWRRILRHIMMGWIRRRR
jgi:hypothetical protein